MNAPIHREILALRGDTVQTELPLAAEAVLRYVWEHRWGSMRIEVREGRVFVNGQAVEAAFAGDGPLVFHSTSSPHPQRADRGPDAR
jgi:hypothetical protein